MDTMRLSLRRTLSKFINDDDVAYTFDVVMLCRVGKKVSTNECES